MMTHPNDPFWLEGGADTTASCLMLHGLGGGPYELRPLAEAIASQGITCQGLRYPGHDQPNFWMPASTWPEWYAHAEAAIHNLVKRDRPVHIVGFSTGCPLAIRLALHYPQQVSSLTLLAPFVEIHRPWFSPLPTAWLVQSVGRVILKVPRFSLAIRDRDQLALAESQCFFRSFNMVAVRSALELIRLNQPRLSEITCPTLFIQSTADTVVTASGAQYLYDRFSSHDKELIWLNTSDHVMTLDSERDRVKEAVLTFLQRQVARTATQ